MKPGFQSDTVLVRTADGHNFILEEDLVYVTGLGARLTIPKGITTDGASVPSALWSTLPPFGAYWRAALLHDWLYRYTRMSKANCDDLLLEAMRTLGVDEATALVIYQGVHHGGQAAFDEDRRLLDLGTPATS